MPTADVTYSRVVFQPADFCALGPVKVYGPDGELIRTIPVNAIRARDAVNEKAAAAALKRLEAEPGRRGKAMTFGNSRKRKVPAA